MNGSKNELKMEMKNNEWNVPSNYFEKNKKAFMPVRNFPNRNWILLLAAACFIGIGLFIWQGEGIGSKHLSTIHFSIDIGSKHLSIIHLSTNIGSKNLSTKHLSTKHLSTKEEIATELKDIPKEDLVAYLLEEDSELIQNID